MRSIFANCPACKQENALTVRVGKKSDCRQATCPACHARFDYSAWILKRSEGVVIHQVELVPIAEGR